MNVFYFGTSQKQLFGAYHPPKATTYRDAGIVLCYPIGQEYMRAHWAFRQLAEQLVGQGFHVLRFDYYGVGDSAGDCGEGGLEQWVGDIQIAAEELRDISGVQKISLIGLRIGAALAALAAEKIDVKDLVLWEPVVIGKTYLRELDVKHKMMLSDSSFVPVKNTRYVVEASGECLGFPFPDGLRDSISRINLFEKKEWKEEAIFMALSEEKSDFKKLYEALSERKYPIEYQIISESDGLGLMARMEEALLPNNSIQAIKAMMTGAPS